MPCQEPPVVRHRIQRAEEAQSMDEIADEGINRNHAFRFELAQRYVDRPLAVATTLQQVAI
jgi:hypothetical protein